MIFDNESISSSPSSIALNYSSLTRRLVALMIDSFILGCLSFTFAMVVPVLGHAIMWFLYAPMLESSELRATIGKHLMGIQVGDLMGRRIALRTAVFRNLMKIISFALLLLGFLVALFSEKKQALHDHLADTVVTYGRSDVPIADAWVTSVKAFFKSFSSPT